MVWSPSVECVHFSSIKCENYLFRPRTFFVVTLFYTGFSTVFKPLLSEHLTNGLVSFGWMCSLQFNKVWKLFISLKIAGNKCPLKAENAILETLYFKILRGSRPPDPWLRRSWLDPPINLPLLWHHVRCMNYTSQSMFATFRTIWDSTYQVTKKLHAIISTFFIADDPQNGPQH